MITVTRDGDQLVAQGKRFPATPDGARAIFRAFAGKPITVPGSLVPLFSGARVAPREAESFQLITATTPWEWQAKATRLIVAMNLLLAADMGTGKTKSTIDAFQTMGRKRMLIAAPKAVVANWPDEIKIHAVPSYQHGRAVDCDTTQMQRMHDVMAFLGPQTRLPDSPELVIVDHATCWREPMADLLLKYEWDFLAVDEAHKIGDPNNKLSQFLYTLAARNPHARRVAMTGTPLGQQPLKVYGIARFIAPEIVGYNQWAFDHRYGTFRRFTVRTKGGEREVEKFERLTDEAAFSEMLGRFTFRVRKDVLTDLPEQTHTRRYAQLDGKARAAYRALEKAWRAEFKGREYEASSAAVLMLRLQQFTGHYKAELLKETLEDLGGEPVVVFARYVEDLATIRATCAALALPYLEQSGRANDWQAFQRGAGMVLGVQTQSGGAGINLTRAAHVIYYSHDHKLTDYDQSLNRVHRPGQRRHVTYTHLLAQNTVDEQILAALMARKDAIEHVLETMKKAQKAQQESETKKHAA